MELGFSARTDANRASNQRELERRPVEANKGDEGFPGVGRQVGEQAEERASRSNKQENHEKIIRTPARPLRRIVYVANLLYYL